MRRTITGTTLIEVLVYVAVFMIVVGGMFALALAMLTGAERANSQVEVSDNARFLIQNMEFTIRNSESVNSPLQGASGDTLSLNLDQNSLLQGHVTDAWGIPLQSNLVVYSVVDNVMTIRFGELAPIPITNSLVTVSSVSFGNYLYSPETVSTIRIKAIIASVDRAYPASISLDFFVSLE